MIDPMVTTTNQTPVLFSTTLRPHRSANLRALNWLLGFLGLAFIAIGLGFFLVGAWPVTGFLGAEIAVLYIALRLNLRGARSFESIDLTAQELKIRRVNHWGREWQWSFHPHWLQVILTPSRRGLDKLELRSHGQSLVIGAFLTQEERQGLFDSLRQALTRLAGAP